MTPAAIAVIFGDWVDMDKPDRIGQLLLQEGLITEEKLQDALEKQRTTFSSKALGEVLIDQGLVKENDFLRVLAKQFRTQYVTAEKLAYLNVPGAVLKLIPINIAEKHLVLPIQYSSKDKSLSIVTPDPMNVGAIDEVKFASGIANIRALIAVESAIRAGIDKFYKGNDRAFELSISVEGEEGGTDEGYQDMFDTMLSEREVMIEAEDEKDEGRGEKLEIEPDEDARSSPQPSSAKETRESIEISSPQGKESVFLGGLDEFPGDDNKARDETASIPSVDIEPVEKAPAPPPKPAPKVKDKAKETKKYHQKMLVVEPHEQIRKFITKLFGREGFEVEGVTDEESVFGAVEAGDFDVLVIKEKSLGEGTEFVDKLRDAAPDIEVHIIKDYGSAMIGETRLYHKLIESFFESLDVVIGLLEISREGFQGHTHQVAKYAKLIAQKMGLARREIDETVMGAYAHDIGKKGMTHYTVLNTIADDFDADILKDSLEIPVRLLGPVNLPMDLDRVISNSLERYDGKGFPGKLAGEDIPVSARILAVVDGFAHLTTEGWNDRKYGMPDAIGFLQEQSGTLFDPNVVDTLAQVVKDDLFVGKMDVAKEHILIADDEADLTTLLELKFVNAGYRVTIARNGEEALAKAEENPPDFMLIDIDIPGIDGFKLIEKLQKSEVGEVPFIYLSGKDDTSLITKAFDLGAEDVVDKPVRVEVLFAKIERIMVRIKRSKKAAAPGQTAGVSGSLSEMSLPDIVQILGAGRRTCMLTIQHNSEQADIYIEEGHIVNTVYNEMKGEEAFYSIIGWEDGTFTINPEVEISERLISKNNDSLMLEGFRRLDEGGQSASPDDIAIDGSDFF